MRALNDISNAHPNNGGGHALAIPKPSRRAVATTSSAVAFGSMPSETIAPVAAASVATVETDAFVPPSSNVSVGETLERLGALAQSLMGQVRSIAIVRDAIASEMGLVAEHDAKATDATVHVARRVDTLINQVRPLYQEAEEIMERLRREERKIAAALPAGGASHHHHQQQASAGFVPATMTTASPGSSGIGGTFSDAPHASRRAPAVPSNNNINNNNLLMSGLQEELLQQQPPRASTRPNAVPPTFGSSTAGAGHDLFFEQQQAQHQQQQQYQLVPRNNAEGISIAAPGQGHKRYVRASQVYVQGEQPMDFGGHGHGDARAAMSGGAFGGNNNHHGHNHHNQAGPAAAAAGFPGNTVASFTERAMANPIPDHLRRQPRGMAHHFCVVEFKCHRMKRYPCDPSLLPGNYVICWGDKGEDCGLVVLTGFLDEAGQFQDISVFQDMHVELNRVRNLSDVYILRTASAEEVNTLHNELAAYEENALLKCQEMASQRGLNMRVTDCEIQFDRQKFTFYFDAPESVDFRDLTRDLHRLFRARIWLENINANVKNVVPEGALSQADKKVFAARGVRMQYR